MAIYTISISCLLYAITSISCIKDKDYPHALMWLSYGIANAALLWYEVKKKTGTE